jgi:hypothetical protein
MELCLRINIPILCTCNESCICRDFIKCKNSCFCGNKKRRVQKRSEYSAKSPDYYIQMPIKKSKSVNFNSELKIKYINNLETSVKIYNLIRNFNLSPRVAF